MNRNGKIARLSRPLREELNRRLRNGEPGEPLLDWLNPLPEVQTVLRAEFAGVPISKQNLSEWRQGGFVEWECQGDYRQDAQETAADAEEIAATAGRLADHLATVLTARYASLVQSWQGEVTDEFRAKLKVLRGMVQDVSHLRRWDHSALKVTMQKEMHEAQREKSEEELFACFEQWIKRPAVHDWICQTWQSPVEREQEKRRLLGRPPMSMEEIARMEDRPPGGGSSKDQHPTSKKEVGPASRRSDKPVGRAVKVSQSTLTPDQAANPPGSPVRDMHSPVGVSRRTRVRRAGAPNHSRGGCAPRKLNGMVAAKESNPVKVSQTTLTRREDGGAGLGVESETAAGDVVAPQNAPQNAADPKVGQASPAAAGSCEPSGEQSNPETGSANPPVTGSHSFPPAIASPCVGICQRDKGGYCTGCLRSVAEIMRWDQMPEVQKEQVLEHVALRRAKRRKG